MEDRIVKSSSVCSKVRLKFGVPPPSPVAKYHSTDNTMLVCQDIFQDLMECYEERKFQLLDVDMNALSLCSEELIQTQTVGNLRILGEELGGVDLVEMEDIFFTPKERSSCVSPILSKAPIQPSVFTYAVGDIEHSVQNTVFTPMMTPQTPRQQRSTRKSVSSMNNSNVVAPSSQGKIQPSYTPKSIPTPKLALGSSVKPAVSTSNSFIVLSEENTVNNYTHNTIIQQLAQPDNTKNWLKVILSGSSDLFQTITQVSVRPPSPATIEKYFAADVDRAEGTLKTTEFKLFRESVKLGVQNIMADIEKLSMKEAQLRLHEHRIASAQARLRKLEETRQLIQKYGDKADTSSLSPTTVKLQHTFSPLDHTSDDSFIRALFSVTKIQESDSILGECRPWLQPCNRSYLDHGQDHCGSAKDRILRHIAELRPKTHVSSARSHSPISTAPLSPRSFYAQKKTSRQGDPTGILSPKSLQTFLRSIEEGNYVDACDCHDKWFYAQVLNVTSTGFYLRFDGWPEFYNESIPFSAAPAKMAPFGSRARKADRRMSDRSTLFDQNVAERNQPPGQPRVITSPRGSPKLDSQSAVEQGTKTSMRLSTARDAIAEQTAEMQELVLECVSLNNVIVYRSLAMSTSIGQSEESLPFPILVWMMKLVHLGQCADPHQHTVTMSEHLDQPSLLKHLKEAEEIVFKDYKSVLPAAPIQPPLLTARQSVSLRLKQPLLPVNIECLTALARLVCVAVKGQAPAYLLQNRETINFLQLLINIHFQQSLWCLAIDAEVHCKERQLAVHMIPTASSNSNVNSNSSIHVSDNLSTSLNIPATFEKAASQPGAWCFLTSKLPLARSQVSTQVSTVVIDTQTTMLHDVKQKTWSNAISKLIMTSITAIPNFAAACTSLIVSNKDYLLTNSVLLSILPRLKDSLSCISLSLSQLSPELTLSPGSIVKLYAPPSLSGSFGSIVHVNKRDHTVLLLELRDPPTRKTDLSELITESQKLTKEGNFNNQTDNVYLYGNYFVRQLDQNAVIPYMLHGMHDYLHTKQSSEHTYRAMSAINQAVITEDEHFIVTSVPRLSSIGKDKVDCGQLHLVAVAQLFVHFTLTALEKELPATAALNANMCDVIDEKDDMDKDARAKTTTRQSTEQISPVIDIKATLLALLSDMRLKLVRCIQRGVQTNMNFLELAVNINDNSPSLLDQLLYALESLTKTTPCTESYSLATNSIAAFSGGQQRVQKPLKMYPPVSLAALPAARQPNSAYELSVHIEPPDELSYTDHMHVSNVYNASKPQGGVVSTNPPYIIQQIQKLQEPPIGNASLVLPHNVQSDQALTLPPNSTAPYPYASNQTDFEQKRLALNCFAKPQVCNVSLQGSSTDCAATASAILNAAAYQQLRKSLLGSAVTLAKDAKACLSSSIPLIANRPYGVIVDTYRGILLEEDWIQVSVNSTSKSNGKSTTLGQMSHLIVSTGVSSVLVAFCGSIDELNLHAPDHLSACPSEYYAGSAMFTSLEPVLNTQHWRDVLPDNTMLDLPFLSHSLGPSWPDLSIQGIAEHATASQQRPILHDGPTTLLVWVHLWDLEALELEEGHPLLESTNTMQAPVYHVEDTSLPVIGIDLHGNTQPMPRIMPLLLNEEELQRDGTTITMANILSTPADYSKTKKCQQMLRAAAWRQSLCKKWEEASKYYTATLCRSILAGLLGLSATTATENLDKPAHTRCLSAILSLGLHKQNTVQLLKSGLYSKLYPNMTFTRLIDIAPCGQSISEYTSTAMQFDPMHQSTPVCGSKLSLYPLVPPSHSSAPWPVGNIQCALHALSVKLQSGALMLRSGLFTVLGDDHTQDSLTELVTANPQLNPVYAPPRNVPIKLSELHISDTTEKIIQQCLHWTASNVQEITSLSNSRLKVQIRSGDTYAQAILLTPYEPPQPGTISSLAVRICSDDLFRCTLFHIKSSIDSTPPPQLQPNPCFIQLTLIEEETGQTALGLLQSRFHIAPVPPKCYSQLDLLAQAYIRVCQHQHTLPHVREQCQSALVSIAHATTSLSIHAIQAGPSIMYNVDGSNNLSTLTKNTASVQKYAISPYLESLRVKAGIAVHYLTDTVAEALRVTNTKDGLTAADEYATLLTLLGGKPSAVPAASADCLVNTAPTYTGISIDASISLAIFSQILICFMSTPHAFRTAPQALYQRSLRTEYGQYQSLQCNMLTKYSTVLHHNTRICAIPVNSTEQTVKGLKTDSMAQELDLQGAEYQVGPVPGNILSETRSYLQRLHTHGVAEPAKAVLPFTRLRELLLGQVAVQLERETARTHFKLMNRERIQVQETQWPQILGKSKLSTRQTEALVAIELALSAPWGGTVAQKAETIPADKVSLDWALQCFSGRVFWQVDNRWCAGSVTRLMNQQGSQWTPTPYLPQEEPYSIAVFGDGSSCLVYPRPQAKVGGENPVVLPRMPICTSKIKLTKPIPDVLNTVSPYLAEALHRSLQLLDISLHATNPYYSHVTVSKPILPSVMALWCVSLPKTFTLDHTSICSITAVAALSCPAKVQNLQTLQKLQSSTHFKHRSGEQLTSKRIPQVNRIQTAAYLLHMGFLRACSLSYARISETYASTVHSPRVLMECITPCLCPAVDETSTIPADPLVGFSDTPTAPEPDKPQQHVSPLVWDTEEALAENIVQAEMDAFALLDTGLYSPWYKLFSYQSPQAVLPVEEHSKQVISSQTPLALLLLPQKKKRMRLLECYLLATARIHADNTPVVKLELPLRQESQVHENGQMPTTVPKVLLPTSSHGFPHLNIIPLVPMQSQTRDMRPQVHDQETHPTPEPLLVQQCRRLRDARCHHLRSTPAQYALRVQLIGNAHAGSVGYPGPYRTVISELATQLKDSAELDTQYANKDGGTASVIHMDAQEQYGDDLVWEQDSNILTNTTRQGLVSTHPQQLQLCSNGQEHQGLQRTAASPQLSSITPGELHLWLTLGCCMGLCVRTGTAQDIDLTDEFWRLIHQGEPLTHELSQELEDGTNQLQSHGQEHVRCLDRQENTLLLNIELVSWDHGFRIHDDDMSDIHNMPINPLHCIRWSKREELGIQSLAHSSLSHARTLTFEQGGVPFTPETLEFAGIDTLVLPIDRGQRNLYIGKYGTCVKLTFAQRRAYTVASQKHLGMLPQLPQVPQTASNYNNSLTHSMDILFPLPWIGHSCYGSIVSAMRAGLFMVLPNIAYDMASLRDKRPRTFTAADNTQKYLSEGVMLHLFNAQEFRQLITGARRVDLKALKNTATVRYIAEPPGQTVFRAQCMNIELWFWEIQNEMDEDNKSRFVHFIWGSKQLPANLAKDNVHLTMQIVNHAPPGATTNERNENRLPTAHTCFMIFEVPLYSTKDTFARQLMLALECQGVNF